MGQRQFTGHGPVPRAPPPPSPNHPGYNLVIGWSLRRPGDPMKFTPPQIRNKYIYNQRKTNTQNPECVTWGEIYLLYWGHGKRFHGLIPTRPSNCYAPHYSVLPYIPLQSSSHSVHTDVGSDSLHWLAACFCWFLAWLTLRPWRWRRYVLPKRLPVS
jgi:hypothetical protein